MRTPTHVSSLSLLPLCCASHHHCHTTLHGHHRSYLLCTLSPLPLPLCHLLCTWPSPSPLPLPSPSCCLAPMPSLLHHLSCMHASLSCSLACALSPSYHLLCVQSYVVTTLYSR